MVKRRLDWKLYLTAGIITVIIFLSGYGFGYFLSQEKLNILKTELTNLQLSQRDTEIESILRSSFRDSSCNTLRYELERTTKAATDLGDRVVTYDNSELIKSQDFYSLKKEYILSLLQQWVYWELFKENCNSTVNTILYFYSLTGCEDCDKQGYVLSFLKQEYTNKTMIFALDSNVDLFSLDILKRNYNITKTPSLLINKNRYEGFTDLNQLRSALVL